MKWKRTDPALIFFGLGALACLIVSIPATATAMDLFHGALWGMVATGVFEFGAVGLELMSLWVPQWRGRLLAAMIGMLIITTLFNYATGVDTYIAAKLTTTTTYAAIRAAGWGWLLTIAASALFPAMLGGFLLGFTARARMVAAKLHTPMAAVALWLSTYCQALSTAVSTSEQSRAAAEHHAAAIEQRLNTTEQSRAAAEQQLTVVRHELSTAITIAEQARSVIEQRAIDAEQQLSTLRRELSTRPAPVEIEIIEVARYRLTYEQLAQLAGSSVSTIRRRLPELVTTIEQ